YRRACHEYCPGRRSQGRIFQHPGICHSECERREERSHSCANGRQQRLPVHAHMKLAYMYATPDVGHSKVTAIQGDPSSTLARIRETGYTGVELLVRDPREIDVVALHDAVNDAGLDVPAICTGEVYGEDKVSFADPDPQCRREARDRMRSAMELAARFGA